MKRGNDKFWGSIYNLYNERDVKLYKILIENLSLALNTLDRYSFTLQYSLLIPHINGYGSHFNAISCLPLAVAGMPSPQKQAIAYEVLANFTHRFVLASKVTECNLYALQFVLRSAALVRESDPEAAGEGLLELAGLIDECAGMWLFFSFSARCMLLYHHRKIKQGRFPDFYCF